MTGVGVIFSAFVILHYAFAQYNASRVIYAIVCDPRRRGAIASVIVTAIISNDDDSTRFNAVRILKTAVLRRITY